MESEITENGDHRKSLCDPGFSLLAHVPRSGVAASYGSSSNSLRPVTSFLSFSSSDLWWGFPALYLLHVF